MLDDSAIYWQLRKSDAYKNVECNQEHPNQNAHQIIQITNQKTNRIHDSRTSRRSVFAEAPRRPLLGRLGRRFPSPPLTTTPASLPRRRRKDPPEARAAPCDGDGRVFSLRRCSSPPPSRASMASTASTTGSGGHARILHVRLLGYPRTSSAAAGPSPREAFDPGGPSRIWWFAWKGAHCPVWCIRRRRMMQ
jgi:hypothetical protein